MTNNSNGTPANWAMNQVMQSKNSSYLYNKEALSTIQHVKVYIVVNDNALSVGYGTTEKPTTNTIAKASATQGSQSITYTKYASKTTTPGQTTTATTYDFDLSSFNATYFTIIPGGSTYIWKVEVTYETSGGGSTPSVSLDPDDELNFATVGVGDDAPAAKTFTITGSNMTAALSIAALTNFDYSVTSGSLSPSEGSMMCSHSGEIGSLESHHQASTPAGASPLTTCSQYSFLASSENAL
jgi:hypothetical protein